ncbi:MAG: hypothetical protein IPG25_16295 [Proteobacteria bacterium]|nr:hypothetical protein [Pseudomonadota bacterium]
MTLNSINPLFTMIDALQPTLGAVRYVEVTVQYADGSIVSFKRRQGRRMRVPRR